MRFIVFIAFAAALLCLLWPVERVSSALIGASELPGSRIEGAVFPRILIDPAGRRQQLREKPRRIVSMVLSSDEILMDLVEPSRIRGMTFLATDRISSNCSDFARDKSSGFLKKTSQWSMEISSMDMEASSATSMGGFLKSPRDKSLVRKLCTACPPSCIMVVMSRMVEVAFINMKGTPISANG